MAFAAPKRGEQPPSSTPPSSSYLSRMRNFGRSPRVQAAASPLLCPLLVRVRVNPLHTLSVAALHHRTAPTVQVVKEQASKPVSGGRPVREKTAVRLPPPSKEHPPSMLDQAAAKVQVAWRGGGALP